MRTFKKIKSKKAKKISNDCLVFTLKDMIVIIEL